MFSRNEKLVLAALAFCVFITGAMLPVGALWLNSARQDSSAEIKRYSTYCTEADTRYRAFLGEFPKAATAKQDAAERENEKHYRDQQTHWCDLLAQQMSAEAAARAAKHASWVTWLTIVGLGFLGWTLQLTRKAVKQTEDATKAARETADITREVGEAAERAQLKVDSVRLTNTKQVSLLVGAGGTEQVETGIRSFTIAIENFGKSSAYNAVVSARCFGKIKGMSLYEEFESSNFGNSFFGEIKPTGDGATLKVDVRFDFDKIATPPPNTAMFVQIEVSVFFEDIFTTGTKRNVRFARQNFQGTEVASAYRPASGYIVGEEAREKYQSYREKALLTEIT